MLPNECNLSRLPNDLPWATGAYLLLDGVSVEALPRRLYEWSASPAFEPLYLETRWAALSDLSPCLIPLSGPQDPLLARFLNQAQEEWGYLLFSPANGAQLLAHLRWLLSVRHPAGEELLLRLADPAVAHALFAHAVGQAETTLFGPIERIVAPDAPGACWHSHQRPGPAVVGETEKAPYRLTDAQLTLLGEVSFRSTVSQLDQHMREYFPAYQAQLTRSERWQWLQALAATAYEQGFASERDITLYANIQGFLGERALEAHPDIADLLTRPSAHTPSQRVERAAELAQERAAALHRSAP